MNRRSFLAFLPALAASLPVLSRLSPLPSNPQAVQGTRLTEQTGMVGFQATFLGTGTFENGIMFTGYPLNDIQVRAVSSIDQTGRWRGHKEF